MLLVLSQQIRPSNFFVLFCLFFFGIILNFVVDEFEIFSASLSDGVDGVSSLPTGSKLNVPLESLLCHSFLLLQTSCYFRPSVPKCHHIFVHDV